MTSTSTPANSSRSVKTTAQFDAQLYRLGRVFGRRVYGLVWSDGMPLVVEHDTNADLALAV